TVCGSGDDPTALATAVIGGNRYAFVAYGASGQVALVSVADGSLVGGAILPSFRPAGPIWHMAVVNAPDAATPVLAIGAGADGVLFYDLADVPAIVAGSQDTLTYLQRATRTDTSA